MARDVTAVILCSLILQSAAQSQESFNTTPRPIKSNFTCSGRPTGYYADVPSNCRVYHNCDDQGNKFSYYCPEMTAFRQEALICDHAHLVDCEKGTRVGLKIHDNSKTSEKSTAQDVGRWAMANSNFQDFLYKKNSTVRDAQKERPAEMTFTNPGNNFFSVYFGNTSRTSSGFRNDQSQKQAEFRKTDLRKNDRESFFADRNETGFYGNVFGGSVKAKEISTEAKAGGDQVTVNSRSHPAWHNNGENFRTHSEVSQKSKLGDRDSVESTTPYFGSGQMQTTRSYFNFKNSYFRWSDNADERSTLITASTSPKTTATIFTSPEIPFRDFTASLKPLVPNALEYDPYYPRESWATTETYYTPSERNKLPQALEAPNFEPSRFGVYFKVPDAWPDLNTLDDIVDRRKLFFIPSNKKL